jgi:anaerobic ribonucleoside-triphosphate reductase activating protein
MLRVAQIVDDTRAEGPGRRLALWVQGCSIRCPNCCNPEMFDARGGRVTPLAELDARLAAAAAGGVEGITILGGEPFEQPGPVAALAGAARRLGLTVLVFTGYDREAIEARAASEADVAALLAAIDVLIDGPFRADALEPAPPVGRRWIGSSNQRVHRLTARVADDPRYESREPNTVELRLVGGRLTVNGWPGGADALRPRKQARGETE